MVGPREDTRPAVTWHARSVRGQLEDIAGTLGVPLDGAASDRLEELIRLWRAYAPAINLIGAHDAEELVAHVADGLATVACAAAVRTLDSSTRWVDVGSGAGLPGLVVAAVLDCELALIEPRQRRAAFLELALAGIGRKGVVSRGRIEEKTWDKNHAEQLVTPMSYPCTVATARAVFEPGRWVQLGEKLVMDGGVLLAHLRPEQETWQLGVSVAMKTWGRSKICAFQPTRSNVPRGTHGSDLLG
ncbi:MAG: class I SAM-dependent methyltransferase [Deltaproteobacteria bacterium]|nr:class I SAM-dependent methyltransferase [Nannocystaceae bacterium]